MEIALLSDYPEYAPQIAQWYYDEWLFHAPGQSLDRVLAKILADTDRTLRLVARDGSALVGTAELKKQEMDIYPEFVHWLGGVYVDRPFRNCGIASALVTHVMQRAKAQGIQTIFLQTENLSGGLYSRHGFMPVEIVTYKERVVLVMAAQLDA